MSQLAFEMPKTKKPASESDREQNHSLWRKKMSETIGAAIENEVSESDRNEQISCLIDDLLRQASLDEGAIPRELLAIFSEKQSVMEFACGDYRYPLKSKLEAFFVRDHRMLVIERLQRIDLRGNGDNFESAKQNLSDKLHLRYCHLEAIPSTQKTVQQLEEWDILNSLIDISKSKEISPREFDRLGQVVSRTPFEIQWLGEGHRIKIEAALIPKELASFETETWFSASVLEFEQEIKKILSVKKIVPPDTEDRIVKQSSLEKIDLDEFL